MHKLTLPQVQRLVSTKGWYPTAAGRYQRQEDSMTTDTSNLTRKVREPTITTASILCYIHGVVWPAGLISPIAYMIRNRSLQVRTLPGIGQIRGLAGPFEALGMDAMIALALLFSLINLLYILAGYWLWKSRRKGGMLAISLLTLSAGFWWGFALPFPPIIGLVLAGLLAKGWKSLIGT